MGYLTRAVSAAAPLLAGLLAPASVQAQTVVDAAQPASIVAALQAAGYKAVLGTDSGGDPKISSAANGANFSIFFYGCEKNVACRSLQFHVGYTLKQKPALDRMNQWNVDNRFATAYLDKEGDPNIKWDVVTEGGVTGKGFAQVIDRWASAMGAFQSFIGW